MIVTSNDVLHSRFSGNFVHMDLNSGGGGGQYDDFVKVIQNSTACFHLLRFNSHFIRQP